MGRFMDAWTAFKRQTLQRPRRSTATLFLSVSLVDGYLALKEARHGPEGRNEPFAGCKVHTVDDINPALP